MKFSMKVRRSDTLRGMNKGASGVKKVKENKLGGERLDVGDRYTVHKDTHMCERGEEYVCVCVCIQYMHVCIQTPTHTQTCVCVLIHMYYTYEFSIPPSLLT